jgi:hypothetical protein
MEAGTPIQGLRPQSLAATIGTLSQRLFAPEGLVDKVERLVDPSVEGSLVQKILASMADINAVTGELRTQLSAAEQQSVMAKLHAIIDDVGVLTASLREQLSRSRSATLVDKVHVVLDRIADGLAEVNALVRDNREPLTRTVAHVEGVSRQLDEQMVARLMAELNRDDPTSMLGKLHVSMDRVNQSLDDVRTVAATGRQIALLSRPAIERTIANAKDMSEQLRAASGEILLAPWKLLYRPSPRETQEMTIFEAARTFAEAAVYLDDAAARLEAALAASPSGQPPDGATEIAQVRDALRQAFERFRKAEDFLYTKMTEPA